MNSFKWLAKTSGLAFAAASLCACGTSPEISETVQINGCDAIAISGQFEATLHPLSKPSPYVVYTGREDDVSTIETLNEPSNKLVIQLKSKTQLHDKVSLDLFCQGTLQLQLLSQTSFTAHPDAPMSLEALKVYGQSRANIPSLSVSELTLVSAAQASVVIDEVELDRLSVSSSAQSRVELAGRVGKVELSVSGQSQADLSMLRAQTVELTARGQARANVWATAHLSKSVRDQARVEYPRSDELQESDLPTLIEEPGK